MTATNAERKRVYAIELKILGFPRDGEKGKRRPFVEIRRVAGRFPTGEHYYYPTPASLLRVLKILGALE
jgi:hypothetical protein